MAASSPSSAPTAAWCPMTATTTMMCLCATSWPATSELISARDAALPSLSPNGSSLLSTLSVSTNGRYIAFASDADNLVPNDTNGCRDVFVRDLLDRHELAGQRGHQRRRAPMASPRTRRSAGMAAMWPLPAAPTTWWPGDTNKAQDVFVRDLQAGTTVLVSVKHRRRRSGKWRFLFARDQCRRQICSIPQHGEQPCLGLVQRHRQPVPARPAVRHYLCADHDGSGPSRR